MTLQEYCEEKIQRRNTIQKEFIKKFKESPLHAFRWCQGTIEVITMGNLAERVLKALKTTATRESIEEDIKNSICKKSQYLNESTSVFANKIDDLNKLAEGKFLDDLRFYIST